MHSLQLSTLTLFIWRQEEQPDCKNSCMLQQTWRVKPARPKIFESFSSNIYVYYSLWRHC